MPSLIQLTKDAQSAYVTEYDNRMFLLKGYGYYGSPSNYEIYEIDPDGNTISKILTSDTTNNEDTYLQMYSPEHDGLIVSGRKSGGVGFIEVWKLDGTKVGSASSPQGAYIIQVVRIEDKYIIVPSSDINGIYITDAVDLLNNTKWTLKSLPSWPYTAQENRVAVFNDKVLIIRFDKGYNGDLQVYDPVNDTFTQLDSWTGSGVARGYIFPHVFANDEMVVWTKAYSDNGFDVMMTKDLTSKVKLSTEPFFDPSLARENQCNAIPVSDSLIAILNTKDASTSNYIRIIDTTGKEVWKATFSGGHAGLVHTLAKGRLFLSLENFSDIGKVGALIVKPDVIKDISATINPDGTITVTGTNISKAEAFKWFIGTSYAKKVTDIPLGQATNIGTGYFRIRGR
jgi:hypothetical protein